MGPNEKGMLWGLAIGLALYYGMFELFVPGFLHGKWSPTGHVAVPSEPQPVKLPSHIEQLLAETLGLPSQHREFVAPYAAALERGEVIILLPSSLGAMVDSVSFCFVTTNVPTPICARRASISHASFFGQMLSAGIPLTLQVKQGVLTYDTKVHQEIKLK